jgi:uncharacterized protein YbbC (DUF1343 family)
MKFFQDFRIMKVFVSLLLWALVALACAAPKSPDKSEQTTIATEPQKIVVGAERMDILLPKLKGKRVAIVANQTSLVGNNHLVDTLLASGVKIIRVFAPEHGFRGDHSAGEKVKTTKDEKTGLAVQSLYGSTKKPSNEMISEVDVLVFDIQDVGARFYTYISTMHYVMEAAAENDKEVIILDRPNPNGFYVDGPVLDTTFRSFVGMHPIPIVHGLTIGELAKMINGERWLKGGLTCKLEVITCLNYTHESSYELPVRPSPNLPNQASIYLYPSLCLFEATAMSVGRGTDLPFQLIGYPSMPSGNVTFIPKDLPGIASKPDYMDVECKGHNLQEFGSVYFSAAKKLYFDWLVDSYKEYTGKGSFITKPDFFDKLAGTDQLRKQLESGKKVDEIRQSWAPGLDNYMKIRKKYLLYPDFQ